MTTPTPAESTKPNSGTSLATSIAARLESPAGVYRLIVFVLLTAAVIRLLPPALAESNFGIDVGSDVDGEWPSGVVIRDFAGHVTFARAVWQGEAGYDVESHIRVFNDWAGTRIDRAIPFGHSPTMLLLLGPLCLVPTVWAYIAWTLAGFAAIWWTIRRSRGIGLVGPLVLIAPAGFAALAHGQTAILSTVAMMYLMWRTLPRQGTKPFVQHETKKQDSGPILSEAIVLWALSAKPPLAVTAGVAMLASGRWKSVLLALGLTCVSTALLWPLLGNGWTNDYLAMITNYDSQTANIAYAWSLRPAEMSNLRGLLYLHTDFGDHLASQISSVYWLLSLVVIFFTTRQRRIDPATGWALSVLAFLLFCPHVSFTENVHLAIVIAAIAYSPRAKAWQNCPQVVIAIGLALLIVFINPGSEFLSANARQGLLFASLLAIGATVIYVRTGSNESTDAELSLS